MAGKPLPSMVCFMFGYIFAAIIGLLVIGFALSSLSGGSSPARRKNSPGQSAPHSVTQRNEPSADEPTPDRSSVASNHEIETAKRHTPPA